MQPKSNITHKSVAVVIPCYNEAASIAQVIERFPRDQLAKSGLRLQLLVVDNNSTDGTAAIAEKAGADVIHEPKKGKGNALRAGFQSLRDDVDYVVMLDGDGTYAPEEIFRLVEPLSHDFCDAVIGSRLGGCIQAAAMSKLNFLGNCFFTNAVRTLYGTKVTDVLTGYFAWKKSALDALKPHIKSTGFAIEMEMITKMARLGITVASAPISYQPRTGVSNLRPLRDGSRILMMLLQNLAWHPKTPILNKRLSLQEDIKNIFIPHKIVFVSDAVYPYLKGGKEKRLHEIAKRLAAMGHDVHIYTMHWWDGPNRVQFEDGVFLHALCKRHEMYHGDRRAIKEGVLFGLACLKLFRVSFDVLDVDHMPFFPIFSSWLVCSLRGRKFYATWHEALSRQEWVNYMGPSGAIAALIERMSIRLPHSITAASAHTKELLATVHGRVKHVELVASGIDTSLLHSVSPVQVSCDVLYAGRLVKDKHVDQLILAVGILAQERPGIRCFIIGQGIEKSRLQREVDRHKLQKNVTFLGPLPDAADLYSYMKAAKVFCSPSVREGFGITALEALSCGTPVVTVDSPVNAARNLVEDGQNGSVVPLTAAALAEAILHWVSTTQKPNITFQAADYDWGHLAQKQAEVYML